MLDNETLALPLASRQSIISPKAGIINIDIGTGLTFPNGSIESALGIPLPYGRNSINTRYTSRLRALALAIPLTSTLATSINTAAKRSTMSGASCEPAEGG